MTESAKIDFIYLSEQDMIKAGVTDMAMCVDTMEEMFGLLWHGDYRMAGANNDSHGAMILFPENSPFPEMPKGTADRRFHGYACVSRCRFRTAGEWYGSNLENRGKGLPRSILTFVLNDADTAAPLAYMSANLLSAYRTGAIPGVGARHLARKDSKIFGLMGPGVMGKTTLMALSAVCPELDTIKIKARGKASLECFLDWLKADMPQIVNIELVDSIEALVRGSDIVSYCGSGAAGDPATYPLVKREWVKPGAFLAMPSTCEIDEAMEAKDVRKVVDNTGLYEAWFDELPKPAHNIIPIIGVKFLDMIADGRMAKEDLEDLGQIVAGEAPGRQNDEEIIILSVGGMPVEDVAWGTVVYRNAVARGIGQSLNLWDEPVLK
ncbi:MAG: ornithine cyclodeaminase [Sphingomonadales bacterium]|nr:ornithine cyclodeaminase [Sphingomonadales bacterium]